MVDEKSRQFLDWVLSEKAPKAVKSGLRNLDDFPNVEQAARKVLGRRCDEALAACRVILYLEERRKSDPGPSKSKAAHFVPIRKFMEAFFARHPGYAWHRPLLDYYLTRTGLSEERIYAPPTGTTKGLGVLTGWFLAIKDRLAGKGHGTPAAMPGAKTDVILGKTDRKGQGSGVRVADRTTERGGCELIHVSGGRFHMGSPNGEVGRQDNEWPVHEVYVKSFYLCRYPVTNEEYARFLKDSGVRKPEQWGDPQFNRSRQPVVGVNWEEARRFAKLAGGRLPSEAEWEYACRAGKKTAFASGDSEPHLARVGWYKGNSDGKLHDVGEKEPNAFGLYDMHGNVWEWCEDDWHGNYESAPTDGSAWIEGARGGVRVARGGSYLNPPGVCRSAFRFRGVAVGRNKVLGFRIAMALIGT